MTFSHLSAILVLFVGVFYINRVLGQVNLNRQPDIIATATNQQCATFFLSPLFANVCGIRYQGGPTTNIKVGNTTHTLAICDSHCRCTHGATYGDCIQRPADAPYPHNAVGALTDTMCKCYYSPVPAGYPTNDNILDSDPASPVTLFGSAYCLAWQATPFSMRYIPMCQILSNNATSGDCETDCVCTHGYDSGVCDDWCSCYYKDGTQLKNGK